MTKTSRFPGAAGCFGGTISVACYATTSCFVHPSMILLFYVSTVCPNALVTSNMVLHAPLGQPCILYQALFDQTRLNLTEILNCSCVRPRVRHKVTQFSDSSVGKLLDTNDRITCDAGSQQFSARVGRGVQHPPHFPRTHETIKNARFTAF